MLSSYRHIDWKIRGNSGDRTTWTEVRSSPPTHSFDLIESIQPVPQEYVFLYLQKYSFLVFF